MYVLILVASISLSACGAPTAPTPHTLTGTWRGSMTDSLQGVGALVVSLDQRGDRVSGSWQAVFPDGSTIDGEVSGGVGLASITLRLMPRAPLCVREAVGTATDRRLDATYQNAATCLDGPTGSLALVRE